MKYDVISLKKSLVAIGAQLTDKGNAGWELITVVHQPDATSHLDKDEYSDHIAYFKKA